MIENEIGTKILDCCFKVHKELGSGLFESVYETVLMHELKKIGLKAQRQVSIPIIYNNIKFDEGFRADIIVENKVILELKSIEKINPSHKKQVITYLKLSKLKLGYLLNFGEAYLKNGITRLINEKY